MKCPKCYREIEDDSLFCEYCGVRLSQTKGNKRIWILCAVTFVVVFAVSLAVYIAVDSGSYDSEYEVAEDTVNSAVVEGEYIDLGLPSGTMWKDVNESEDFYDYDTAMELFGDNLPTKEQWEELKDECTWSWTGSEYKVTGNNGNSINLPAAGYRFCGGGVGSVGSWGGYWSSTPDGSEYAWCLGFNSDEVGMNDDYRSSGQSVRLVQD